MLGLQLQHVFLIFHLMVHVLQHRLVLLMENLSSTLQQTGKEYLILQLTVASTREKVIMIEAGANEVPEEKMIEAIFKAHEVNQKIIEFIDQIVAECGKPET